MTWTISFCQKTFSIFILSQHKIHIKKKDTHTHMYIEKYKKHSNKLQPYYSDWFVTTQTDVLWMLTIFPAFPLLFFMLYDVYLCIYIYVHVCCTNSHNDDINYTSKACITIKMRPYTQFTKNCVYFAWWECYVLASKSFGCSQKKKSNPKQDS